MIIAFSTSSPIASVAALSGGGEVLWSEAVEAPRRAGAACMEMLSRLEADLALSSAKSFVADIGPGSFTGVRVGVILAKTLGFLYSKPVGGASAFDLIDPTCVVALPSKKGEYFVRDGGGVFRTPEVPDAAAGYGPGFADARYPLAERFAALLAGLQLVRSEQFLPEYLLPPSISVPKKPYGQVPP